MSAQISDRSPILFESHSHTPLCQHAVGEPTEYAAMAQERGLKGLIVTCHCPMPDGYSAHVRMAPEEFDTYVDLVNRTTTEWRGKVDVLLGLESDYLPGGEKWLKELHARADFHYILGSVHPQIHEYRALYYNGDNVTYQRTYFTHLAQAAETGLFDSLAHPDLIKNESPRDWDLERMMPHIQKCLDRIAATGVAMELNTSGDLKAISEMNPAPDILREIHRRGIPVVLGADAHLPKRVGDRYEKALSLLQKIGFETVSCFRERKRYEIPIPRAMRSLMAADAY
jgi:histidinol-phosphatase (PHP family)